MQHHTWRQRLELIQPHNLVDLLWIQLQDKIMSNPLAWVISRDMISNCWRVSLQAPSLPISFPVANGRSAPEGIYAASSECNASWRSGVGGPTTQSWTIYLGRLRFSVVVGWHMSLTFTVRHVSLDFQVAKLVFHVIVFLFSISNK